MEAAFLQWTGNDRNNALIGSIAQGRAMLTTARV